MDTEPIPSPLQPTHTAYEAYKRRQVRITERKAFYQAGTIVFAGLLLAVMYYLLYLWVSK
jgi:hypothetical protein